VTEQQPQTDEKRSRSGPREGLILLLFTLVTIGVTTWVLVTAEQDAVDDPVEKAARGEIDGLDDLSMLREENLRRALDDIADSDYPLVTSMRVDPERINATVRDSDGIRKVFNIDAGFDVDESDFGAGEDEALAAANVNAAGPERMIETVVKRTDREAEDVDYVALSVSGNDTSWLLYIDEGPARDRQWAAAADGSDVRRPGEPSALQRRRTKCFEAADNAEDVARCTERFDS
jgi:hypothetical protein